MTRFVVRMDTKKCYNEIGLHAQNAGIILGLIVSTIGRASD